MSARESLSLADIAILRGWSVPRVRDWAQAQGYTLPASATYLPLELVERIETEERQSFALYQPRHGWLEALHQLLEQRPFAEAERRRDLGDALVIQVTGASPIIVKSETHSKALREAFLGAQFLRSCTISAPSGAGKEAIARGIAAAAGRAKPFVAVDCGAIPSTMFESEFFGHVRGAFTGAERDKAGAFERAHGGTLFLDEIAESPLDQQVKLLRVLETRTVMPLGSGVSKPVDVLVVAATNRDLQALVAEGKFREELAYRIAPRFVIPSLSCRSMAYWWGLWWGLVSV